MSEAYGNSPLLWGALGALVYAAPRFSASTFAAVAVRASWVAALSELVVSLATGTISAAAFGPWVQAQVLKTEGLDTMRAIAALIGLMANPVAPAMIEVLSGRFLNAIRGQPGAEK